MKSSIVLRYGGIRVWHSVEALEAGIRTTNGSEKPNSKIDDA
ncbi:hypothetical protein [Trichormus variabilis]|nr:hypothetical protein [Trichormus variabilis]